LKRNQNDEVQGMIPVGIYHFLRSKHQIVLRDKKQNISEKETELLILINQNNHRMVRIKEILEKLSHENDNFLGRSLDIFRTRLGKYLKKNDRIKFDSVRGVGFKVEYSDH